MAAVGEVVEHGERRCKECGKTHDLRQDDDGYVSWRDPGDDHPYMPEAWEEVARRLSNESGLPLA